MSAAAFDPRKSDPRKLDLQRLAAAGATVEGRIAASAFERLAADAPPAGDGQVAWQARGELRQVSGGAPETWLHLRAGTAVRMVCQRCLQPLEQPLSVARSFRFVGDESLAERLDEDSEDDVLALPPRGRLDLTVLVEDELILALPLVPRHETCPDPLPLPAEEAVEEAPRENPFAALAALKKQVS